jgi:hypothetical protein
MPGFRFRPKAQTTVPSFARIIVWQPPGTTFLATMPSGRGGTASKVFRLPSSPRPSCPKSYPDPFHPQQKRLVAVIPAEEEEEEEDAIPTPHSNLKLTPLRPLFCSSLGTRYQVLEYCKFLPEFRIQSRAGGILLPLLRCTEKTLLFVLFTWAPSSVLFLRSEVI